jgi:formate hydrogenlyase subunit 6/NADH:ubiquinone oxidoreductase subunit I
MRIKLKYFTGTGNSLKVLNTCRNAFIEANHTAEISSIGLNEKSLNESDLLGFCFPVYAFGIPRICRKYLKNLKKFKRKQKTFIIITAGDPDESGFSINECVRILRKKNCEIIYTAVVQMPINWTVSMNPPSKEEYIPIINDGVKQSQTIATDLLNGIKKYHTFNIPKRYGQFGLYREYILFKYLGIYNLWRLFQVYDSCNGCQICSKICPTGSITMVGKKPKWSSTCEQCMRCVNFCPNNSIYQSYSSGTIGRNRYYEPDFKPPIRKDLA